MNIFTRDPTDGQRGLVIRSLSNDETLSTGGAHE